MFWLNAEPSEEQVEAAAKAWLSWQFPGRSWEDAVPSMKKKFRDGARRSLAAAISAGPQSNIGCA